MACLNINSILVHIDELRVFMTSSKTDILAIIETKLYSTIDDNEILIPGFEIIRKDRTINGRYGGGICMYLRSGLNFRIRHDLYYDQLECLIIEIVNPHSKPFLVDTWYRPPKSSPDLFHLKN